MSEYQFMKKAIDEALDRRPHQPWRSVWSDRGEGRKNYWCRAQ